MADFLIQHLKQKGEEHSALAMLVNQWGFDEKLIPKALQAVGVLFPHYSRHDESHSKQILVNIERLLGDNINLLTATDTWLILEAAYWHDIGMVVTEKDTKDALCSQSFLQYVEDISRQPHNELNRFAKSFNPYNMSTCFIGADTPIEAVDNLRQLISEWFRRLHAERSNKTIQTPWDNAGINSPRTELIPARLFKLLGRICQMHGMPFNSLLAPSGLPFKEVGLAQEDCHPRFVACMLRLGDLLDLDDNRFCPVMQRIVGEKRSRVSKAHEDKHSSIRHLRMDCERIEITAECNTIDGYIETFKWFDMLKQEIQDQMSNWQDIVPNRKLGLLPTLGTISVKLSGELSVLEEGQRPEFTIDAEKTIELIQGENIYSSKFSFIRELLQNAVDATLLKLWLTKEKSYKPSDWKNPLIFAKNICQDEVNTGVLVTLSEETLSETDSVDDKSNWILKIIDKGTGISRNDLKYMLRIGGAQSNFQRQTLIRTMPEWMKPSGAFGIGFQSVFMLCDEILLTTKSIFTNETLQITMHSPIGDNEGLVLLKLLENDISLPYGTTIETKFKLDNIAKSWAIPIDDFNSIASKVIHTMDPVLSGKFPYEAANMADMIQDFSANSLIPINMELIVAGETIKPAIDKSRTKNTDGWHFIKTNDGNELSIAYQLNFIGGMLDSLYRGQPFKNNFVLPNVNLIVDIMSGSAKDWLTANRDALASNAKDTFIKTVLAALKFQVEEDICVTANIKLQNDNNPLPIYSLFLEKMALKFGGDWVSLANKVSGKWLDLLALNIGSVGSLAGFPEQIPTKHTFRDYFDKDSWTIREINYNTYNTLIEQSQSRQSIDMRDLTVNSETDILPVIFNEWQKDNKNTIQILGMEYDNDIDFGRKIKFLDYQLKKEAQPAYDKTALAIGLTEVFEKFSFGNARAILNSGSDLINDYRNLFLKKDVSISRGYNLIRIFPVCPIDSYFIMLPFLYRKFRGDSIGIVETIETSNEKITELCKWIQPNLLHESSFEAIRTSYNDLINYIDNEIMPASSYNDFWKGKRNI